MFQYLESGYKGDGDSFFTRNQMEKARGNEYKLVLGRFPSDTRGNLFTELVGGIRRSGGVPTTGHSRFTWAGEVPSNLAFPVSMKFISQSPTGLSTIQRSPHCNAHNPVSRELGSTLTSSCHSSFCSSLRVDQERVSCESIFGMGTTKNERSLNYLGSASSWLCSLWSIYSCADFLGLCRKANAKLITQLSFLLLSFFLFLFIYYADVFFSLWIACTHFSL